MRLTDHKTWTQVVGFIEGDPDFSEVISSSARNASFEIKCTFMVVSQKQRHLCVADGHLALQVRDGVKNGDVVTVLCRRELRKANDGRKYPHHVVLDMAIVVEAAMIKSSDEEEDSFAPLWDQSDFYGKKQK